MRHEEREKHEGTIATAPGADQGTKLLDNHYRPKAFSFPVNSMNYRFQAKSGVFQFHSKSGYIGPETSKISLSRSDRFWYYASSLISQWTRFRGLHAGFFALCVNFFMTTVVGLVTSAPANPFEEYSEEVAKDASDVQIIDPKRPSPPIMRKLYNGGASCTEIHSRPGWSSTPPALWRKNSRSGGTICSLAKTLSQPISVWSYPIRKPLRLNTLVRSHPV